MLGFRCCVQAFPSCGERGPHFVAVRGLLIAVTSCHGARAPGAWASIVVDHRFWNAGSVVVVHGPSCSIACEILPDQGSNPCPLHWQVDSQQLRHQGSPRYCFQCNTQATLHFRFGWTSVKQKRVINV